MFAFVVAVVVSSAPPVAVCAVCAGEGDMSDSPTTVMPQATASPFFIGQQVAFHPLVKPNETRYS